MTMTSLERARRDARDDAKTDGDDATRARDAPEDRKPRWVRAEHRREGDSTTHGGEAAKDRREQAQGAGREGGVDRVRGAKGVSEDDLERETVARGTDDAGGRRRRGDDVEQDEDDEREGREGRKEEAPKKKLFGLF